MLLATIQMVLNSHSPTMYLIYYVHGHISQPSHIYKNVADNFDWLLDSFIDIYSWIALHFDPFDIGCIFWCLAVVLFGEKCQKFSRLGYIPPYFIYTLLTCLNRIVDYVKETSTLQACLVLILQCIFNFIYWMTSERAEKSSEVERRIVL